MWHFKTVVCLSLLIALAGCSTPEERAANAQEDSYEAQEEVAKRRLELVEKYQACIEEAAGDSQKAAACETYLKAAEALQ